MKRKVRFFERHLDFGDNTLILIVYNKESEALDILKNTYDVEIEHPGDCEGFAYVEDEYCFLCLKNGFQYSILVHELTHLVFKMLDRYSITLNEQTEETFAMQMESLFRIVIILLIEDRYKLPIPK